MHFLPDFLPQHLTGIPASTPFPAPHTSNLFYYGKHMWHKIDPLTIFKCTIHLQGPFMRPVQWAFPITVSRYLNSKHLALLVAIIPEIQSHPWGAGRALVTPSRPLPTPTILFLPHTVPPARLLHHCTAHIWALNSLLGKLSWTLKMFGSIPDLSPTRCSSTPASSLVATRNVSRNGQLFPRGKCPQLRTTVFN